MVSEVFDEKIKEWKGMAKKATLAGVKYGEERGVVEFEATDSAKEKSNIFIVYLFMTK